MKIKSKIFLAWALLCLFVTTVHSDQSKADFLKLMNSELPSVIGEFSHVDILEDGGLSFINSVYLVHLKNGKELVIKIGNPIWKGNKTENEVVALKFLQANTTIPVPEVVAYESDISKSCIQNEYIVMNKMAGKPLSREIERIYKDKVAYHKVLDQLASAIVQLKAFHFKEIGNFKKNDKNKLEIGGIVDFAEYEVEEPCKSYSQYALHAMKFYIKEMEQLVAKNSQDSKVYQKYIPLLKDFISATDFTSLDEQDVFVFSHQDFVMKNILVDDEGVTAVLDWEWSGSALMENESMTGFDFLLCEEDKHYFTEKLSEFGVDNFFDQPPLKRQLFYRLLGNVYTLVAFREWKEGKLEHTAKFLSQKLEQRKIRSDSSFERYDQKLCLK